MDYGSYIPGTPDYGTAAANVVVTTLSGDQSRSIVGKMERAADSINNKHIQYNPLTTNSNAAAREVLELSSFIPKDPPV